jgi:hypothetical protein
MSEKQESARPKSGVRRKEKQKSVETVSALVFWILDSGFWIPLFKLQI